jgi:RNA polymerase sigma-70 factor, ECF subfamily
VSQHPVEPPALEGFEEAFRELRGELLRHCYQMTGSYHDAEDLVQETYIRARRGIDRFEQRSSLKTWLYRIATNTCLTALSHRGRRVLPSGLGAPSDDPDAPASLDLSVQWIQPLPDAAAAGMGDPADVVVQRDSVRLALIAAIQHLPPRQRAVLLLREVLQWRADEVADALDISVPAVKSLLQRARRRLSDLEASPSGLDVREENRLLERYINAFESSDIDAVRAVIHDDFSIEMPPSRTWLQGLEACLPYLERRVLGAPGDWNMVPTRVNGQPAAVAYLRDDSGCYRATGFCVLTVAEDQVIKATVFKDPWLVAAAKFPMTIEGRLSTEH